MRRRDLLLACAAPLPAAPDPDRPSFHLMPPSGWMNDPNGPIFQGNLHHLFYQYNPHAAKWDTMHWGHAVTRDLLHWEHRPIALAPTRNGPDKDGCFSGCAVLDGGQPVFLYTGVHPEVQCRATSHDWTYWTLDPSGPVIEKAPAGYDAGFRDPQVWRDGSRWRMVLGSGTKGKGGAVLQYTSPDLRTWTYDGELFSGPMEKEPKGRGVVASGEMWECPDFFPAGRKWILYVATANEVRAWSGVREDNRFHPEWSGVLCHGPMYAPKSLAHPRGGQLLWGWVREARPEAEQLRAGWSGVMTLPIAVTLGPGGRPWLSPRAECAQLRRGPGVQSLEALTGGALEIEFDFDPQRSYLLRRGDRAWWEWNPASGEMALGATRARIGPRASRARLFFDGSLAELFVDGYYLVGRGYSHTGPWRWHTPPRAARVFPLAL